MGEERGVEVPRLVPHDPDRALVARLDELHRSGAGTQEWPGVDGRPIGYSGVYEGRCFIRLDGIACYLFGDRSGPVEAYADGDAEPEWIEDGYRRLALPLVVQARGTQVLHASAVDSPAGLVILCGFSGAGKSTLAYGLSRRGCAVWADDAVAFTIEGEAVAAHPLPFRVRLLPDAAGYFLPSPGFEGRKLELPAGDDDRPCGSRAIAAVLLLEASGPRTGSADGAEIMAVSSTEAFRRVLSHGYFFHQPQEVRGYRHIVEDYLELAARVPFYRVGRGEGVEGLEARIEAVSGLIATTGDDDGGPR